MKRLFTLIICFLSLQIVKASPSFTPAANSLVYGDNLLNIAQNLTSNYQDTIVVPVVNQPAPLTSQSGVFKRRLDSIKKDIQLDYNEYVQSYIDIYAHNRDEMGHVLGLTKYYFPIYEKAFHDAGIPDEIKYLSIVESKLDPYAVSRVGATGPWQFMFTTGKLYGLNIDDYIDERRDPVQASYAAAAYLKDAYEEFGDWLLAIASYNCGKSNVEHAIDKAGGTGDFWTIRQYLPVETRGYVPAFIAVAYIMNYYNKLNIIPQPCNFALKTDTVLVNKYVSLGSVAQVLNIDVKDLANLNPAYKRQIINGTDKLPRRLIIPQIDKEKYSALYETLNNSNLVPTAPKSFYAPYTAKKEEDIPSYHKVKRGETLGDIADTYGIELHDLKAWNHLHSGKAVVGQRLRLKENADLSAEKPSLKNHDGYITYKVKAGDTLSSIASKFEGASVEKIRSMNGLKKNRLQPGMTIKISKG
ncbi:membrane-bound lytic murein transglycosylase D [Mucilaginibacter frigoritolerans]|uniref:Membrane-bound lytic murein transglycosylase D n=1 Tax=Mucilaginibacter frigoritolerans TaxID=652788 RepID=A0A562U209_9SPHI|nr:lytic transglycosylase domain-containing protein [Mucilaginibacter frigoritolerans]TWI99849.1 membrane-bound lytic murein transglycosylase D [Mucilaginibacter frigoritolerans]